MVVTGKGKACLLLRRVEREWHTMSPAKQAELELILERLAAALRRDQARPVAARVPLVGRVAS